MSSNHGLIKKSHGRGTLPVLWKCSAAVLCCWRRRPSPPVSATHTWSMVPQRTPQEGVAEERLKTHARGSKVGAAGDMRVTEMESDDAPSYGMLLSRPAHRPVGLQQGSGGCHHRRTAPGRTCFQFAMFHLRAAQHLLTTNRPDMCRGCMHG